MIENGVRKNSIDYVRVWGNLMKQINIKIKKRFLHTLHSSAHKILFMLFVFMGACVSFFSLAQAAVRLPPAAV